MPDRWPRGMRADMAAEYVGLSVSALHREAAAGRFPPSVALTPGRTVWLREQLDGWLDWRAGLRRSWRDPDISGKSDGSEWLTRQM